MKRRLFKAIFFKNRPQHLILYVTAKCPSLCKTCFAAVDNHEENPLSLPEIRTVAEYMKNFLWLEIAGGEPFLREDLADICAFFKAKLISVPTSGFEPALIFEKTKEIKSKISAELNIAVSIDGFEEINDDMRGEGSFKQSMETLKMLKKIKGIRVKVNTVLCNKNVHRLTEFMEFIKEFKVDAHSIILLIGVPRDATVSPLSYEELLRQKENIFSAWEDYDFGFKSIERKILREYLKLSFETSLEIIKHKRQIPKCLAGHSHLVIYPQGEVAFCEMLPPVGNFRKEKNLKVLLYSEEACNQRKKIGGGLCYCHHNCNMLDNYFLNIFKYPKVLKRIF